MKDIKTGKEKEYKMKKDNVLLYDGGFIDYEHWDAPIIMDLKGLSMNVSLGITAYGYEESKTAFAIPCIENYQTLYAVINEYREDSDIRYGYKIVAKEGRYLMPKETIAINGRTLEITDDGAWLVSKATLIRITATKGDKPTLEFIQEDDYLRTLGTKKGQDGEKKMDMETLNQCSQVLHTANRKPDESMDATFTNEEMTEFFNGRAYLTLPLVYEDESNGQCRKTGEVVLTHVTYGVEGNTRNGILFTTPNWPRELADTPVADTQFVLNMQEKCTGCHRREYPLHARIHSAMVVGFHPAIPCDCDFVNVVLKKKTCAEPAQRTDEQPMDGMQKKIADMCDAIKNLLLEKNRKYGNSALNPVRVFSKADTAEQIKVRMDDKLSRIKNEQGDEDEDVYMDLAGYLVLMLIAKEEQKKTKGETDK